MTPQELAALHASAFHDSRAWSAEEFEALMSRPGTHLVASTHCFALIRVIADEAELLTLATSPNHRRKGLARKTLAQAETLAKSNGAEKLFLEVSEINTAAQSLYIAQGFREIGRRPNYYLAPDGTAVGALVLQKSLGAR